MTRLWKSPLLPPWVLRKGCNDFLSKHKVDASALAPLERELTERQAAFVEHYVENGGNVEEAATLAGYADRSSGYANLRNPLIQKAILAETLQHIGLAAVPALKTVSTLAASARSEYVRLQAATDLLDRAGFKPPDKLHAVVDADLHVSLDIGMKEGGVKTGE